MFACAYIFTPKPWKPLLFLFLQEVPSAKNFTCPVCMQSVSREHVMSLVCGHQFCRECWQMHFKVQIMGGVSTGLNITVCHLYFCQFSSPSQILTIRVILFYMLKLFSLSSGISCMAKDCDILAPEDFVYSIVTAHKLREKYQEYSFHDYVKVS